MTVRKFLQESIIGIARETLFVRAGRKIAQQVALAFVVGHVLRSTAGPSLPHGEPTEEPLGSFMSLLDLPRGMGAAFATESEDGFPVAQRSTWDGNPFRHRK
jgi:hypothetical protein